MKKFVPYEKLSKQKQRELDKKKRGTWGPLDPVTRRPKEPKAYVRKKARSDEESSPDTGSFTIKE